MCNRIVGVVVSVVVCVVVLTGCASIPDPHNIIIDQKKEIRELKTRLEEREKEFGVVRNKLMKDLKGQIKKGNIKIEQLERGLVLTVLEDILFDSGKIEIKSKGKKTLTKVAAILKENCPDKDVSIEGHTDNQPIKYSRWKSNWELSTARASSVLHFFIDKCGIKPNRLRVVGFGEYTPAASNDAKKGRQQNRRVEIVILPEKISKVGAEF